MIETILKGGSLATTSVIDEDGKTFVRKKISLEKEREYGYYRWYSQLKKLQRYDKMFPGKFVKVFDFGVLRDRRGEHHAHMDLEFHQDSVNCYEYLCEPDRTRAEVVRLARLIFGSVAELHEVEIDSSEGAMGLYFQEEIVSKLKECLKDESFKRVYNDSLIPSMLPSLKEVALHLHKPVESYTHGNLTLENILFLRASESVVFIDPYEENIIDNRYNDYSQILQSCYSHYELLCDYGPDYKVPRAMVWFNSYAGSLMALGMTREELLLTRFFECSQFYRMLPFKLKASKDMSDVMPFLRVAETLTGKLINAI
jgi:hypothetical protein